MPDPVPSTATRNFQASGKLLQIAGLAGLVLLVFGGEWVRCDRAGAQSMMPSAQPSSGFGGSSPLNPGPDTAVPRVGIPLGSIELATPGVSPAAPPTGTGAAFATGSCSSANAPSSGAVFDGGGLPGVSSLPCNPQADASVSLPPSTSSAGRAGIPLGSTELGGAGLSSALPVPFTSPSSMGSNPSGGATSCPANNAAAATATSGGC